MKGTGGEVFWVTSVASFIVPKVDWIPHWEGETRKYSQQVLAKCVNKTKWKISFLQESAVAVRGCCYFSLSSDGVMNLTVMDIWGLWYFHSAFPDDESQINFLQNALDIHFIYLLGYIFTNLPGSPVLQFCLTLNWYCLAPLKCYFLRTVSEGTSFFCLALPVTRLCHVAGATFPLGQTNNVSYTQYDCVHLQTVTQKMSKILWYGWGFLFTFNILIYFLSKFFWVLGILCVLGCVFLSFHFFKEPF